MSHSNSERNDLPTSISLESTPTTPTTLVDLYNLGFKLLPLSIDNTVVIPWTSIYENPDHWTAEKLITECSMFKNVATVFGKTHVEDSEGKDLYLNGLDCDSEPVYKILITPTDEISNSLLKSKLLDLYSKYDAHPATARKSMFEYLKEHTVVVKTRKPYGFQAFWLSHTQHDHIGTKNCKSGHEFEIKTDKSLGHATLPPSTHRNDKTFRYSHIGRTDKIETIDQLHSVLIALLQEECLVSDPTNANDKQHKSKNDDKSRRKEQSTTTLYDLSEQMIQTTVAYFTPYYIVGRRQDFALCFSGVHGMQKYQKIPLTKSCRK